MKSIEKIFKIKWQLVLYDLLILLFIESMLMLAYKGSGPISLFGFAEFAVISSVSVFSVRLFMGIYRQIWRYGGIQSYIRLLISDGIAFAPVYILTRLIITEHIYFTKMLAILSMNLLCCLSIRMFYLYIYKSSNDGSFKGRLLNFLMIVFAGRKSNEEKITASQKIKVAIVGAGRVGVSLASELVNNPSSSYIPRCFIDINRQKAGRTVQDLPIIMGNENILEKLRDFEVQEVIFAFPNTDDKVRKDLYEFYKNAGYKVKVYDYPIMQIAGGKRHLREFDIEELLFRKPLNVIDSKTAGYYKDKVVLITGGGGSIGSELCRQIAKMMPKQLIVLDIYENGAYDVQQELKIIYKDKIDFKVEIVSVCNRIGLERVFREYKPQIVLNAAAHKHVPLMEKNCIEAVENNVFGTLNTVELSEKYGVERFMMVSTDKAVNPTNIMGATKRMCEMIVECHANTSKSTTFSATRFGNVLGSAGSVIPLFKRQIANGGPVTVTDKRIIRYFMTIPEASQLVLTSAAMAKNGELFVLDMGAPVKILELAENMIRISGFEPYKDIDIIETGLRPGEKLYEELLVKSEDLHKTENSLIFIEHGRAITKSELDEKLSILRNAVISNSDENVRKAMHIAVPTYKTPEDVNAKAKFSAEMQIVKNKSVTV